MKDENIYDLFLYDEEEFIRNSYLTLLKREPDKNGLEYYLSRLRMAHGKNRIIYQLSQSVECRPHEEVSGLIEFFNDEKKCNKWFLKAIGFHRYRLSKKIKYNIKQALEKRLKNLTLSGLKDNNQVEVEEGKSVDEGILIDSFPIESKGIYPSIEEFLAKKRAISIDKYNFNDISDVFSDGIFLRFIYLWLLGRAIDPEAFKIYSNLLKEKNDRLSFVLTIEKSEEFRNYKRSNQLATFDNKNYPFGNKVSSLVKGLIKV